MFIQLELSYRSDGDVRISGLNFKKLLLFLGKGGGMRFGLVFIVLEDQPRFLFIAFDNDLNRNLCESTTRSKTRPVNWVTNEFKTL